MGEERDLVAILEIIETGCADYSDDERAIIDSWTAKFRELSEDQAELENVLDYAEALAKLITGKQPLTPPFHDVPPGALPPFSDRRSSSQNRRQSFQIKRMPCTRPKTQASSPPQTKKANPPSMEMLAYNEFEDPEEMAKAIARSKGQTFAEFVASISRHTKDFGRELRAAMKAETSSFRDYVDHVLSQRIKDLTEVLDEEQNRELLRIKKDTDKWLMELSHLKKRIKELVPAFDIDLYRKDRNFLKTQFTIDSPGLPQDDSFKRWQEENWHRLKWIVEMTNQIARCNRQIIEEISDMKSNALELEAQEAIKQQNSVKLINCEIAEYQRMKQERDQLRKENAELLSRLQDASH